MADRFERGPDNSAGGARIPSRRALRLLAKAHIGVNRLSRGHLGNRMQGHDVCFVTMTGAKSGRMLTKPLMYVPHEDGVLLVASLGGGPKNPVWHGNLVVHPEIVVRHRGRTMRLTARLATADATPALWPICDHHFPPYADYRTRTDRDIPIFVCAPEGAALSLPGT